MYVQYDPRIAESNLSVVRRNWGWFIALGVALIALGVIALGKTVAVTAVSVMFLGWLLLAGGVIQAVHAFWVKDWSNFFLSLFVGILDVVVGFLLITRPVEGALSLTLLIGFFFLIGGIFRMIASIFWQTHNRFWVFINGLVNFVLGLMIVYQWPISGLWIIGLFIAINLIMSGWTYIAVALAARSIKLGAK